LELDHTKPYSKGGTKLALAHRDCNRMKGSRNLKDVQKKMGFKTTKKKKQVKSKPSKKKKSTSPFDVTLPKTKFPLF
jgi:5-methylcytosine-specific restriction endonuclease McrA